MGFIRKFSEKKIICYYFLIYSLEEKGMAVSPPNRWISKASSSGRKAVEAWT
jgi:hypothetical protein